MPWHHTPFDDPAPDAPYSLAVMAIACVVFGLVCGAVFLVVVS